MNNNFRYDNYRYSDMNMITDLFMQSNNSQNQQINNNPNLAEPYEGFIRGNLFNNLYHQYRNHRPSQLVPSNEQAELLLNVDQLTFAAHELNLYLDVHPEDQNMIRLFNQYQKMANEAIERYEKKYGPLTVNTESNPDVFSWQAYSWPWEREEM
ncbi:MAG: spore coat protein CotJB [bacterium]|nr:spore coat protein CotJB [bacterium]